MITWPLPPCGHCNREDRIFNLGAYVTDSGTFTQVWVCLNCGAIGVAEHSPAAYHDHDALNQGPQD